MLRRKPQVPLRALHPCHRPAVIGIAFLLWILLATLPLTASADTCVVTASSLQQQIDGFGAGAAFLYAGQDPLPEVQMDTLFGTSGKQFGLTIIRVRIPPDGDYTAAVTDGQRAHARGAKILATPWTPPASMKDNNSLINGGSLLPAQYTAYATYLDDFAKHMAANGAPLSVISIQNEPDWQPDYESCKWTAEQLRTFCRDNAGAISVPVMMPESLNFNQALSDMALNDSTAAANVDYIGGHLYGVTTIKDYPLARSLGKHIWMTEYLENDQTLSSSLATARQISDCLSTGNMSAYIWWKCIGDANGLLNNAAEPQRRGYIMAQFSRYVRPGDYRVAVTGGTGGLAVTAYVDSSSGRCAIVVVNDSTQPVIQSFRLEDLNVATLTPVVTTSTLSLEPQASVGTTGSTFASEIPAQSVVTFHGASAPVIRNAATAALTYGTAANYQIDATFGPTSFSANGLPPGLSLDMSTGAITGSPTATGSYTATLGATNPAGTGSANVVFNVASNSAISLGSLTANYDGTPKTVTYTVTPANLAVTVTYDGNATAPTLPGTYAVAATVTTPGYSCSASGTLVITAVPAALRPDGFAATATGGGSAEALVVDTASALKQRAETSGAAVITIVGNLDLRALTPAGVINVSSNKTIQGRDAEAGIVGGISIGQGVSNVAVRGLTIANPTGDGIAVSGASNVYINHCTLFDCAGYLLNIADSANNVTASWNEFYYTTATATHRLAVRIGSSETTPLRVTLHHNLWSQNADQYLPAATYGYVHLYSNCYDVSGNTAGAAALANSQILAEYNLFAHTANPLAKSGSGLIRAIGNVFTSTTGTTDAGTDAVFTPGYSYELTPPDLLPAVLNAALPAPAAGNVAGASSAMPAVLSASISAPSSTVTAGGSLTLTASPSGFTASKYQWRFNNADISGATGASHAVANAQSSHAGTYTVAITNQVTGSDIVSTPVVVTVNAAGGSTGGSTGGGSGGGSTAGGSSGGGGGGAVSAWLAASVFGLFLSRRLRLLFQT